MDTVVIGSYTYREVVIHVSSSLVNIHRPDCARDSHIKTYVMYAYKRFRMLTKLENVIIMTLTTEK